MTRGAILTRDFLHRLYGGPPPALPPQAATVGFAIPQDNSEGSNDGYVHECTMRPYAHCRHWAELRVWV